MRRRCRLASPAGSVIVSPSSFRPRLQLLACSSACPASLFPAHAQAAEQLRVALRRAVAMLRPPAIPCALLNQPAGEVKAQRLVWFGPVCEKKAPRPGPSDRAFRRVSSSSGVTRHMTRTMQPLRRRSHADATRQPASTKAGPQLRLRPYANTWFSMANWAFQSPSKS